MGDYGDKSWATPDNFWTNQFVFIEDNTFEGSGKAVSGAPAGALDMFSGARIVFRYNAVNTDYVTSHRTESLQRERCFRIVEMYNNAFTTVSNSFFTAFFMRGGTGVVYDNTYGGTVSGDYRRAMLFANFRDNADFAPWEMCSGTNAYDEYS